MKRTLLFFTLTFITALVAVYVFPYYSINPGVLVHGHEQLRNDCLSCHSIGGGPATEKCVSCHPVSGIGITNTSGVNAAAKNNSANILHTGIKDIQCYYCHTEHSGSSREAALVNFKHSVLSSIAAAECSGCHQKIKPADLIHQKFQGECSGCHTTEKWKGAKFQHSNLAGGKTECNVCHDGDRPQDTFHKNTGKSSSCSECHTTNSWKPSTFNHESYFRFDRNHPSDCKNCHDVSSGYSVYTCYNCHEHSPSRIAQKHLKEGIRNYTDCVRCHRSGNEHESGGGEGRDNKHREKENRNRHEDESEREHDDD